MSLPTPEKIQCPECGEEFEVTVFHSINDSWPDAVKKIITGELFRYRCPHCGLENTLEYEILFNDFEHQAWIQVIHEPERIPTYLKLFETTGEYMPGVRNRVVHSISELRQKVMAFYLGRDDRVIELCRYICYMVLLEQCPDFEPVGESFYAINPDTNEEAVFFYGKDGEQKCVPLQEDIIQDMTGLFKETATEEDRNRYVYDFAWAEDFFADEET